MVPTLPLVGVKLVMVGMKTTVKLVALVPVPVGPVTEIGPAVAPEGTVAVICVAELTVKLDDMPLNETAVAPVKFVPVIVTLVPIVPLVGVKLVIEGGMVTVKFEALFAVPSVVVTEMGPVVAPLGTGAVICVEETTVKLVAVPLNVTPVVVERLVPLIVTVVPTGPLVGVKELIVGGKRTVKLVQLVPVPSEFVTAMGPVVAPAGTVAVICVEEFTVKLALTPLNVRALAPEKLVPVIVTVVPTGPLDGVKLVIPGTNVTVKLDALEPVPDEFVTRIGPDCAPGGTVAEMTVSEFIVNTAPTVLNCTPVALEKLVPWTVTGVPSGPFVGVKLDTVGADCEKRSALRSMSATSRKLRVGFMGLPSPVMLLVRV